MILTGEDIFQAVDNGIIQIEPFDASCLGPNSYDVHLSPFLARYGAPGPQLSLIQRCLAPAAGTREIAVEDCPVWHYTLPPEGAVLHPGILYLGATLERTYTPHHVPWLDGRSTTGRRGISVHLTAGRGDIGFDGHWTLEISVVEPVRLIPGTAIGQVSFFTPLGNNYRKPLIGRGPQEAVLAPYKGKYRDQRLHGPRPVAARPDTKPIPACVQEALAAAYRAI